MRATRLSWGIRRWTGCERRPDLLPRHAILIVEERLREQEAEGVEMPEGIERDELALRILVAASPAP